MNIIGKLKNKNAVAGWEDENHGIIYLKKYRVRRGYRLLWYRENGRDRKFGPRGKGAYYMCASSAIEQLENDGRYSLNRLFFHENKTFWHQLKGTRLGHIERRIMHGSAGGEFEDNEPGELAGLSPEKWEENIYAVAGNKVPTLTKKIFSSPESLENKHRATVHRAVSKLEDCNLVASSLSQNRSSNIVTLTRLGEAVYLAYEKEITGGERIRWNKDKIIEARESYEPEPSGLEQIFNKFKKSQS